MCIERRANVHRTPLGCASNAVGRRTSLWCVHRTPSVDEAFFTQMSMHRTPYLLRVGDAGAVPSHGYEVIVDRIVGQEADAAEVIERLAALAFEARGLGVSAARDVLEEAERDWKWLSVSAEIGMERLGQRFAPELAALLPVDAGPLGFAVEADDGGVKMDDVMRREFVLDAPLDEMAEIALAVEYDFDDASGKADN